MESEGKKDCIQVSHATAQLLIASNKGHWVTKRKEAIIAKGKGSLQTYWVSMKGHSNFADSSLEGSQSVMDTMEYEKDFLLGEEAHSKEKRLIEWSVEMLSSILKQVIATHVAKRKGQDSGSLDESSLLMAPRPIDEVHEIIRLPAFHDISEDDIKNTPLPKVVSEQLQEYVTRIAGMYRDNPFHNFEHASHVCMSVIKVSTTTISFYWSPQSDSHSSFPG